MQRRTAAEILADLIEWLEIYHSAQQEPARNTVLTAVAPNIPARQRQQRRPAPARSCRSTQNSPQPTFPPRPAAPARGVQRFARGAVMGGDGGALFPRRAGHKSQRGAALPHDGDGRKAQDSDQGGESAQVMDVRQSPVNDLAVVRLDRRSPTSRRSRWPTSRRHRLPLQFAGWGSLSAAGGAPSDHLKRASSRSPGSTAPPSKWTRRWPHGGERPCRTTRAARSSPPPTTDRHVVAIVDNGPPCRSPAWSRGPDRRGGALDPPADER